MSKKTRSSKEVSYLDYFLSDLKAVGSGAGKYVTLNCMQHHFDFFFKKPKFKIIIDAYIKTDIKESKRKLLFFPYQFPGIVLYCSFSYIAS